MNENDSSLSTDVNDFRPGVLSRRQIQKLGEKGIIKGLINEKDIDPSSFDLHLGWQGWEMKGGVKCLKGENISSLIANKEFTEKPHDISIHPLELTENKTYLFQLKETIHFREYPYLYGRATGRSSIGRLDVLVRLLINGHPCYDEVPNGYDGELFIEITPITFPIKIQGGLPISQLRIFKGDPELNEIKAKDLMLFGELMYGKNGERITNHSELSQLTLNLDSLKVDGREASAYKAQPSKDSPPIDLSAPKETYDSDKYWQCEKTTSGVIKIETEKFYILRSRERFRLPEDIAVYGQAVSENLGEIRIHYAGFAHPWFGHHTRTEIGTPLIFEVRGHNVDTFLRDGEVLANIKYYRMSEVIQKEDKEKVEAGSYQRQELTLSKYFKPWK